MNHQKYRVTNVVSCTEGGQKFIERAFWELREKDGIPDISKETHAGSLHDLNKNLGDQDLEAALKAVKGHPYFRECFDGYSVMVAQVRNAAPSDVSIVYRYPEGQFQLQRWFAVALTDPSGPIFVDRRLVPATKDRKHHELQRRVFCVHELAPLDVLTELAVFRSIYRDKWESWFAIVTERDAKFTWVLTFWCQLHSTNDINKIRGGLEMLAMTLSKAAQVEQKKLEQVEQKEFEDGTVLHGDSLRQGMLVLSPDFKEVRRQNYAAESIMRRFRDASGDRLDRGLLYERFENEYRGRCKRGLNTLWQVDEFGRVSARGVVALNAEALGGEVVIRLTELTPAPPEAQALMRGLEEYTEPSGLITYVKKEQRAVYVPSIKRVARPLLEDDLIADRIYRYPTITGTELDEFGVAGLRDQIPYALRFRTTLVGVLLPA
jgi:hypothetical protein